MYMKYATNKRFSKNTIHPDPNLWQHKPSPEIIEKCMSIADYPHISKKFAKKTDVIDYAVIEKYTKLFESYDGAIISGYLKEGSPLFIPTIVDSRLLNKESISAEYSKFIQFLYEVQCALTEFYVYVNQFQFQFRKTLLPIMEVASIESIKPFMIDELLKPYGDEQAYSLENAYKVARVYDLYLCVSYGLKTSFQYIYAAEHMELSKDIESMWMMCGYTEQIYKQHYNLLSTTSNNLYSDYRKQSSQSFPGVIEDIYQTLLAIGGAYQKEENGNVSEYALDQLLSPCDTFQQGLMRIFANEQFPSRLLGSNAVLQLSSDLPNPMLVESEICSFELSVFSFLGDHRTLMPEFVMFGGIYNHVRDCINYPLIFQMVDYIESDSNENLNYFKEFMAAIARTLMLNYEHILFENKNKALENQVKRRMKAQLRN